MRFHIELENSWTIPQRLMPQPQIIPLCSAITSPALLRRLKHYKGTQQVEFLQLTSLFLSKSDGENMFYTHDIIYDDQAVAFVDVATQRQIQNQLQNTGISLPPTTTSLAANPPTPHVSTTKPTYAAQLESLKLLVKPSQAKPATTSTGPFVFPTYLDKTQEIPNSPKPHTHDIPKSPKPQTHKKKVQPDKEFHPTDSDDSDCNTLIKDKYLLNPKSFMTSTLKNLTELNCSKPTQPDHIDTTTNPPRVEHTDDNLPPPTRPGHTEVQANSSQTNAKDIEEPQNDTTSRKITFLKQIITHPIHQFSKVALLMAHNSLPNVQAVTPDGPIRKDFVLTLESYMDNMFQATHNIIVDHCKANGHTAQPLHLLLKDRYFLLTRKPHFIIKHYSDDSKEKVCWACLRIFKKTSHLQTHWTKTKHEDFTQMQNDGHAKDNTDCNKHFKEIMFPILTHTRALPRFYFTEHHSKLDENTLPTDLNFVQVIYNMFTRAFFALPMQIVKMCNNIFGTDVTLPLIQEQRTHIYNAISNLSWDIPEIQELLYFHHPEDAIHISDNATQDSQDESTDTHDTSGLHGPESNSETEDGIHVSTPAHSDQWSPPEMDDTVISPNPDE